MLKVMLGLLALIGGYFFTTQSVPFSFNVAKYSEVPNNELLDQHQDEMNLDIYENKFFADARVDFHK